MSHFTDWQTRAQGYLPCPKLYIQWKHDGEFGKDSTAPVCALTLHYADLSRTSNTYLICTWYKIQLCLWLRLWRICPHWGKLGWEDPLEKGMAPQACILAWRILRTECLGSYIQSMGLQRVGHDWVTHTHTYEVYYYLHFTDEENKGHWGEASLVCAENDLNTDHRLFLEIKCRSQ